MDAGLFHKAESVLASSGSPGDNNNQNDDLLAGADESPFRPFIDTLYVDDGLHQDVTTSGAMPLSTAANAQQPTVLGPLVEESRLKLSQDGETLLDTPKVDQVLSLTEPEVVQEAATIPARAASPTEESATNGIAKTEHGALPGGREASVDMGGDIPRVSAHISKSTEVITTEANGQSALVVEAQVEMIEETGEDETRAGTQDQQIIIEEHVDPAIETSHHPSETESLLPGEAVLVDTNNVVAASPPSGAALETQQLSSPDSASIASIPAGTPPTHQHDLAIGSMSVPPKRKAASIAADPGAKRRRRTAADMLVDASTSFVDADYSERKKRSAPLQSHSFLPATPVKTAVKTPGRKNTGTSVAPRVVAALKTPKAEPTARKSMVTGPAASPAIKARTPRSAPSKVRVALGRPPKSATKKTPTGAKAQTAKAVTDETPRRRGRPAKSLTLGTPAMTPAKAPEAGTKRRSLSGRLSAPRVTKIEQGSTPDAQLADTPKRRGRPPKNASAPGAHAKSTLDAKAKTEEAPEARRGRGNRALNSPTGNAAPARARNTAAASATAVKNPQAETAKSAKTTGSRSTRAANATTKVSSGKTPNRAKRTGQSGAPEVMPAVTASGAPKRRGRPPKAAITATTVAPPSPRKRGRGAAEKEVVEPQPKKQKKTTTSTTTRKSRTASAPQPEPEPQQEPAKKNKRGRPPKNATLTNKENATAAAEPAREQDTASPKPARRGRPKKTGAASAPEPVKTAATRGRGRGQSGKGDVAAAVKEKPAAKAAAKTSVASGRVTKAKTTAGRKTTPRGTATATRSLRSRT